MRKRGACEMYKGVFCNILKDELGIHRGSALILADNIKGWKKSARVDAIIHVPHSSLISKPISKCTAKQLGQYIAYIIHMLKVRYHTL
mmetsp:Transcript_29407/g.60113  ORF Transcript_29407/g.60113 Transcript_29407/m.60113 type:complete len:88 (-) Transcript_29407:223-486(-)